eukprot:818933-Rhodomonas_salina.3
MNARAAGLKADIAARHTAAPLHLCQRFRCTLPLCLLCLPAPLLLQPWPSTPPVSTLAPSLSDTSSSCEHAAETQDWVMRNKGESVGTWARPGPQRRRGPCSARSSPPPPPPAPPCTPASTKRTGPKPWA